MFTLINYFISGLEHKSNTKVVNSQNSISHFENLIVVYKKHTAGTVSALTKDQ